MTDEPQKDHRATLVSALKLCHEALYRRSLTRRIVDENDRKAWRAADLALRLAGELP